MTGSSSPLRAAANWLFRDRATGAIVVAQPPNAALWLLLGTVVARLVVDEDGTAHDVFGWVGLAALGWWAVDEVVRGVNPWRRVLGVGGCLLVAMGVAARA